VKYDFVKEHAGEFRIASLCRVLRVSRSGYYGWLTRPESARAREDRGLVEHIHAVHLKGRRSYGSVRTWQVLNRNGIRCGKHRVARLRKAQGIEALRTRRFRYRQAAHEQNPPAPNHLQRVFEAKAPNQVWAGDVTYIPTRSGWLYLAVLLDLHSRKVVGWCMRHAPDLGLIQGALEMALLHRKPNPGLIHHTDRGQVYRSRVYQDLLAEHGMRMSMSRTGDPYDNAAVESFFSTLKNDLVHHRRYATREEAKQEIFEFIEVFYNRQRAHTYLGYRSPVEFEGTGAVP
jgi:transposase InsO family protein